MLHEVSLRPTTDVTRSRDGSMFRLANRRELSR